MQDTRHVKLNDRLKNQDMLLSIPTERQKTFRTKVTCHEGLNNFTELGEQLFEEENETVLGGAFYTLERLFEVNAPFETGFLNDIMGIANTGVPYTEKYPKGHAVCLFGVGIGGAGENIGTIHDVKFQEREIVDMIPFRVTAETLPAAEQSNYWLRKDMGDGTTGFYLKSFASQPVIKALWKDNGDEDGSEVQPGVQNTTRTEPIETFVEIVLHISKKDCREWFQSIGEIELARVNSLALFAGIKGDIADGVIDYRNVKMFSKLNFGNELLYLAKDLIFTYRIYTS